MVHIVEYVLWIGHVVCSFSSTQFLNWCNDGIVSAQMGPLERQLLWKTLDAERRLSLDGGRRRGTSGGGRGGGGAPPVRLLSSASVLGVLC